MAAFEVPDQPPAPLSGQISGKSPLPPMLFHDLLARHAPPYLSVVRNLPSRSPSDRSTKSDPTTSPKKRHRPDDHPSFARPCK